MRRIKRLELQLRTETDLRHRQVSKLRKRIHELEDNTAEFMELVAEDIADMMEMTTVVRSITEHVVAKPPSKKK